MVKIAKRYAGWLEKYKLLVIAFWTAAVLASIYFAPRLISKTTYTFEPPEGSLAAKGNKALQDAFPTMGDGSTDLVIFIYSTDGSSVIRDSVNNFTLAMNTSVYSYSSQPNFIGQYIGYYIALSMQLNNTVAKTYISSDNTTTIILVTATIPYSSNQALKFSDFVQKQANSLFPSDNTLKFELLGTSAFLPMLQKSAERDFLVVDGVGLPLALLVLAYILRSLRLMLIPILCIGTSIVVTFGLMYLVASYIDVVAFTPSLMMSILVAMSFDYSLFLLSRYREDLFSGIEHRKAIQVMLSSAGHTIIVSGVTLAGTFMGLAILPIIMLRTLGLGSAISIITTLLVNISLTPAILLTFNKFFPRCVEPFVICGRQFNFGARLGETQSLINDKPQKKRTFWYKLSFVTTKFPWNIIIVVVVAGLIVPFGMHSLKYKTSDSFSIALPRHYPVTNAYNKMTEQFGYGTVYPYVLLMKAPDNETVMSSPFFIVVQNLLSDIAKLPNTDPTNIFSVPYADNTSISYDEFLLCSYSDYEPCRALMYESKVMVNTDKTAMISIITLSWDPLAQNGSAWLKSAREILDSYQDHYPGYVFYFTGINSDSLDAIDYVYSAFPIMGAVTVGVVLLFVGIAFRSVFVPFRAVLTIMLTLAFVYGFATFTYQYNILKWMKFEGLYAEGSLSWIPPLVSFSIIVGIGLDYDIFLITRIQEFRVKEKYSTRDAIMKGVHKTGGIITAAGVIMAIAFSGLLVSNIGAMNQLSFYLVFAVLFDTFIVRSMIVPAMMGLMHDLNWWPSRMPEPEKSLWF